MNCDMHTVSGQYFNTFNTITAACAKDVLEEALLLCGDFNDMLSKTIEGSDVWRINHAQGAPVCVSHHTAEIIEMALTMHRLSGGVYNIAVGGAVALWHFNDGQARVPDQAELDEALARADVGRIRLQGCEVTVPEGMQIDLGGIAKGYIADMIGAFLREQGVRSGVINLGGNVLTIGAREDGAPWQIGLQYPVKDRSKRMKYWAMLESRDDSIVTSGCYERGFERAGKWYHHILDPRTGQPVQNDVLSVTVQTRSSFLADALTTPLFILGEKAGMELAARCGAEVAYYLRGDEILYSRGMNLAFVREDG